MSDNEFATLILLTAISFYTLSIPSYGVKKKKNNLTKKGYGIRDTGYGIRIIFSLQVRDKSRKWKIHERHYKNNNLRSP